MMNGKTKKLMAAAIVSGLVIGYTSRRIFAGKVKSTSTKPSVDQYINRLKEFFVDDFSLDSAKDEFFELLGIGLSPTDSFEITKSKVVFQ